MKTTEPIYNGYSIRQILNNFPETFSSAEKRFYIKNCIEVNRIEKSGLNRHLLEGLRNFNFAMIRRHYEMNKSNTDED